MLKTFRCLKHLDVYHSNPFSCKGLSYFLGLDLKNKPSLQEPLTTFVVASGQWFGYYACVAYAQTSRPTDRPRPRRPLPRLPAQKDKPAHFPCPILAQQNGSTGSNPATCASPSPTHLSFNPLILLLFLPF